MSYLLLRVLSFFQKIINAGVVENESLHQKFRQQSINSFCLCCIACSTPHYFIFYSHGLYSLFFLIFFLHVCFVGIMFLNSLHHYTYAKLLLVFVTNFSVLSLSLMLGFVSGFHLYIFTAPIFIFWLFDKQKIQFVAATFVVYIGLYLLTEYRGSHYSPEYQVSFKLMSLTLYDLNALMNLMLIFLLFYSYFNYHNLLNNSILEKQKGLESEIYRRTESENNTKKLFDDLSVSYKNLEQFSFVVSHNMRAPLANIKGFVSLYNKNQDAIIDENAKIIECVEQSAEHLDGILSDLNSILKNKNGVLEEKEEIVFDQFVDNITRSMFKEISSTETVITKEFGGQDTIYSTRSLLKSILYNIVQNAIKYRKSSVSPCIGIEFYTLNSNYIIKISDNGVGIDLKRYHDRIFKLYSRFQQNVDGKGIGLYLVKSQVELLGGTIQVESEVNKGTIFIINLPKTNINNG